MKTLRALIYWLFLLAWIWVLAACGAPPSVSINSPSTGQASPTVDQVSQPASQATPTLIHTPLKQPTQDGKLSLPATPPAEQPVMVLTTSSTPMPSPAPALPPSDWKNWPVTPVVSQEAVAIYQKGLAMGNDPTAFSKVGDCQNITNYFLGIFDDPQKYRLGPYSSLQPVIDQFKGSFSRNSLAVKGGFNVAAVLNPIYADPSVCNKNETPLACEFRLHKPSIVIISMETWWAKRPASIYEKYLRQIVDFSIQQGTLPILATKADNLEGDESINASIAQVAYDDHIPLWNFWRAVQPLPYHGLTPEDPDHFHLTGLDSKNDFDDPKMMLTAWPVRNLTALEALNAAWQAVNSR